MRVLVLLSPAKTLNWAPAPSSLSGIWSQPRLLKEADPVIEVMRGKTKADLKKLMSVSDSIADLNFERFKKFMGSEKVEDSSSEVEKMVDTARPAALAYDGPAYRGLDAATFSEEDWTFGSGSIRLLSGLYGVLRPTDLIQPYRLEMGSRVGVAGKKDLYEYWRGDIAQCLLQDVEGGGSVKCSVDGFLVVNVASQEYSKAVDFGRLESAGGKVVTCVFKDDGRVLSVFAKRARGLLARHVVLTRASTVADLEAFSSEGYVLDRSQSGDGLLVFTRSKAQRAAAVSAASAPADGAGAKSKAKPRASPSTSAVRGGKRSAARAAGAGAGTGAREDEQRAAGSSKSRAPAERGKRVAPQAGKKSGQAAKSRKKA